MGIMIGASRSSEIATSHRKTQGHQADDRCGQQVGQRGSSPQQLSHCRRQDEYSATDDAVNANRGEIPNSQVSKELRFLLTSVGSFSGVGVAGQFASMFQGPTLREYAGFNNNNICVTALECQGRVQATLLQWINRLGKAGKENREFLLYVSKRNSRMVEQGWLLEIRPRHSTSYRQLESWPVER